MKTEISPCLLGEVIFVKVLKRPFSMDRTVFQQMGLGKLDIHMRKNEVGPSPNTICKVKMERAS